MKRVSIFSPDARAAAADPSWSEHGRTPAPFDDNKDYANRLVAVSKRYLSVKEAAARIDRDIEEDFLVMKGPGEYWGEFNKDEAYLIGRYLKKREDDPAQFCCAIQIDFLNPTAGYLDVRGGELHYAIVNADFAFETAMRYIGIDPAWWTISCTTQNDHQLSACRRTIIALDYDPNGNATMSAQVLEKLIDRNMLRHLENILEEKIRPAIQSMPFD
jgi:hypothetical protein